MRYSSLLRLMPLIVMLLLVSLIASGLFNNTSTTGKHQGKVLGNITIDRLDDPTMRMNQTVWKDQVAVINVFASWCAPCLAEQAVLMELAQSGKVPIYGIAWRDTREDAIGYLQRHGNPYQIIGLDQFGRSNIAFSLTGVPETLVVGRDGVVHYHHVSALTREDVMRHILPLVETLRGQ